MSHAALRLEPIEREDLEELFAHRATVEYWRGSLTPEQYLERTRRIFAHPFARERIRTWVLRETSGKPAASMDVLDVEFLVKEAGRLATRRVPLLTSLVTAPEARGRGHASALFSRYMQECGAELFYIFSDIGAPFYERLGFNSSPLAEVTLPARAGGRARLTPVSLATAAAAARKSCKAALGGMPEPSCACLPDELFLDWHLERYRAFAALAGRSFPGHTSFSVAHDGVSHALVAAPDPFSRELDCIWIEPGCESCAEAAQDLAAGLELKGARLWQPIGERDRAHEDCIPMLRATGGQRPPRLVAPQIGTWF